MCIYTYIYIIERYAHTYIYIEREMNHSKDNRQLTLPNNGTKTSAE